MSNEEIKKIIFERLNQVGEQFDDDFLFDYVDKPNVRGIFQINDRWFIFESDEKNVQFFIGPFNDREIIYASAKKLHKSKFFEEYRFSSEARNIYIHGHYRSIKEIEDKI